MGRSMRRWRTAEVFDLRAKEYDRWYEKHLGLYLSELKVVREFTCKKALEIGIGTGRFACGTGIVVGIDPSLKMLRRASKDLNLVQAVGEHLPFREKSFDCAFLIATLCFVDDPLKVLEEGSRVAGRVITCIIPRESSWGKYYGKLAEKGHPIYSMARFYLVHEVVELAAKAGLHLKEIVATLRRFPGGDERIEDPKTVDLKEAENYGFVCMEFAAKNNLA